MAYYRIHNKGTLWQHDELVAAGTISPGMLCEVDAAGEVQAHSLEGGKAERLIAMEDALQGNGVDTDYSAGDIVTLALVVPGETFNMLVASGESGYPGDYMISAGDGTLKNINSLASAALIDQVIGVIDPTETAFTTLAANTLKAVRII